MDLHSSNRSERLIHELLKVVREPLGDATTPEIIVVQSAGMGRWLSMELARRLSVWALPAFPFPRRVLDDLLDAVIGPPVTPNRAFTYGVGTLGLARLLADLLPLEEFAPLQRYVGKGTFGPRHMQLAQRLAAAFDRYTVARPDLIAAWDAGTVGDSSAERWQARLWRELTERLGFVSFASRARELVRRLEQGPVEGLPPRLSLFGISSLPPLFADVFAAIARHVPVRFFSVEPGPDRAAAHAFVRSTGRLGLEFQEVLRAAGPVEERASWEDPGTETLLRAFQSSLFRGAAPAESYFDSDGERGIAFHRCHGPQREIEVLHDQLTDLFRRDPTLAPDEVIVMAPDIEAYAPVVEAVFQGPGGERPAIPFHVCDQRRRIQDPVSSALARALELLPGRLPASAVLDLLRLEPVRARFDLTSTDLETVRRWTQDAGIRFAEDAFHREAEGQPALDENTWRFGLDRLFMGFAVGGEEDRLVLGVVPARGVEGGGAEVLGRFAEFLETLFEFRRVVSEPRAISTWCGVVSQILDRLIVHDEMTAGAHQEIRDLLDTLSQDAEVAAFDLMLDYPSFLEQAWETLDGPRSGPELVTGAVTFCQMVPMRTIPFRVICLVGMNGDSFPRNEVSPGFDLMAAERCPGDRLRRDDDRQLFLEAVLAARDHLLITYVGRSLHDDALLPPSVLVTELLEHLEALRPSPKRGTITKRLVVEHPLQPFSPRYFGADADDRLLSYSRPWWRAAQALRQRLDAAPCFLEYAMTPAKIDTIAIDDMVAFFRFPTRFFLQKSLGLYLGRDHDVMADREPLVPTYLARWQLSQWLLEELPKVGASEEDLLGVARGQGVLPLGEVGRVYFEEVLSIARALLAAGAGLDGPSLEPLDVELDVQGVKVLGVLTDLRAHGQFLVQASKLKRRVELSTWIRHVVLNCVPEAPGRRSILIGRSPDSKAGPVAMVEFAPLSEPMAVMEDLVRLFLLGRRFPLPLFAVRSREYVQRLHKAKPGEDVLGRLGGHPREEGFGIDPYVDLVFGDVDPLSEAPPFDGAPPEASFTNVSKTFFGPLLSHMAERSLA